MKDKTWEADFKGRLIRATNKLSFIPPRTSEMLEIDNVIIEHKKSSFFRVHSTIISRQNFDGIEHEVEVRIAPKAGGIGTGCQLLVDSNLIGGDNAIQYPDPEKAKKQFERGFLRYFLSVGLLNFGLPFAIMMAFFNKTDSILTIVLKFIFHASFFGLAMSYLNWRSIKSRVAYRKRMGKEPELPFWKYFLYRLFFGKDYFQ